VIGLLVRFLCVVSSIIVGLVGGCVGVVRVFLLMLIRLWDC